MTSDMFQDAISLLPNDLIAETDKLRSAPSPTVIQWKRWVALAACLVLVLSTGLVFYQRILPGMGGGATEMAIDQAAAECAPEAPAAMYSNGKPTEAPAADASNSITSDSRESPMEKAEPEEALTPTGYPADGAWFIDLSAAQSLLTYPAQEGSLCIDSSQTVILRTSTSLDSYLRDWGDDYNLYSLEEACAAFDEGWFERHDLLFIRVNTEKSELVPVIDSFTFTGPESCEIVICGPLMPEDNSPDPACWHILLPVKKGLLQEAIDITLLFP